MAERAGRARFGLEAIEAVQYAQSILRPDQSDARERLDFVIEFLQQRLTEAAISGCHHCNEGQSGSPCWWCGLANQIEEISEEN